MKIAVDAMGADYGPGPVIEGVVMALSDYPEYEFVLVGHSAKLPFYLEKYGIAGHPRISIVHAETVCGVGLRRSRSAPRRILRLRPAPGC
ncbi:MAG: hypothetical protein V8T86_18020 [Victivallis sp.]